MSAHYHYVRLPARKVSDAHLKYSSIYERPELWDLDMLGVAHLSFVGHSEYLIVWQDKISKKIFYGEFSDADSPYNLFLAPAEMEYKGYLESKNYPELWIVYPDKVEQFCHFVMGWKPNVWDYDKEEREEICAKVKEAIKHAPDDNAL